MTNDKNHYTLGGIFERSGIGLHSGIPTTVRVLPAIPGEGRYFVRVDLPEAPIIRAQVDAVHQTKLSTELGALTKSDSSTGGVVVRTVEHLLAALACSGVDDARIEIDGPEVPLLDGSALLWVEAIQGVGVVGEGERGDKRDKGDKEDKGDEEAIPNYQFPLHSMVSKARQIPDSRTTNNKQPTTNNQQPIWIYQEDAFVAALPASSIRFTYGIDFDLPAIGNQWYSWTPTQESFAEAIAPARTFGLVHQIEGLRKAGLIKGGSLENALVCGEQGWLNPPLRFSNEPVRHKLLDLVGDLSLLGKFPVAHFLAYKASHNLHIQLAQRLAQTMANS
ncbi:MAG: UDP-3-O-acyl-N-acetylglucosamine deacetylase [Symploca sp. SIO1A3]|nr:UDP-3-O-acyl-N-acetylglucosamine deacetylase [Symploca sp. SIO1A3]